MRTVHVRIPNREYEITMGSGVIETLPDLLKGRKAFVVTDSNVNQIYGEKLSSWLKGTEYRIVEVPAGENSKNIDEASRLWNEMTKYSLKRSDVVVAFGGGVIGDLAGFAASTYMRGVNYIQVPTTLIAQIDSSVGGKTAVNIPEGKNLVGAFHQPEIVLLDVDFLKTLPEREIKAGFAEAAKYTLIGNEPQYQINSYETLASYCCSEKAKLVVKDEFDRGERMFLNFGHTFGHAIEKLYNYERFNHGEAVTKGMVLALETGVKFGITSERVHKQAIAIMNNNGLDLSIDFDTRDLIPIMHSDKKNSSDIINLVLLKDIGTPVVVPVKIIDPSKWSSKHYFVKLPPSKSVLHRKIICAALTGKTDFSQYHGISEDIDATINCMNALMNNEDVLDCKESGSTLRFLIPIAAALGKSVKLVGEGRLLERPLSPLLDVLSDFGVSSDLSRKALSISGQLESGTYKLPGDVSSQFVSGLLLAIPLISGAGEIELTTPLQSASYVDITIDVMEEFGVTVTKTECGYKVNGEYKANPEYSEATADWSQAAFFLVANVLGCEFKCTGLDKNSLQGDRIIEELIQQSTGNGKIAPQTIDVSAIPDLVPPLAAMLCFADGVSELTNAGRLRLKESNRLETVSDAINNLGGNAKIVEDSLIITGVERLAGGTVNPHGDHRIAMMAAVLSLRCDGDVWLANPECVKKSYPNFWKDFEGGLI